LFPVPSQHQARCLHTSFELRSIGWALIVDERLAFHNVPDFLQRAPISKIVTRRHLNWGSRTYRATTLTRRHDQKTKRVSERCGTSSPTQFGWRFCQPAGSICVERTLLASRKCIRRWVKDTIKRLTSQLVPYDVRPPGATYELPVQCYSVEPALMVDHPKLAYDDPTCQSFGLFQVSLMLASFAPHKVA
jgi:hypothetical protein